jgi:hypothetical protein
MLHITEPQFTSRFVAIMLAGQGMPKKQPDRQIIFVSAILHLDPKRSYTESELNDALRRWTGRFGESCGLDHVTLRRYLIDEGYIARDSAGAAYRLTVETAPTTFDPSIRDLHLDQLLIEARIEREKRKQNYIR